MVIYMCNIHKLTLERNSGTPLKAYKTENGWGLMCSWASVRQVKIEHKRGLAADL